MTNATLLDVASLHEWYWGRFLRRVASLTDDEYLWEPVTGCWTVRPQGDGTFVADFEWPEPSPTPVTTIAWRMTHLGARPTGPRSGMAASGETPSDFVRNYFAGDGPVGTAAAGSAAKAISILSAQYESQAATLARWSDEDAHRSLREYGLDPNNRYAESSLLGLLLHCVDEQIHHMAEVGLLRDLYRASFKS